MLFGINKPSFPSPPLPLLLVFCSYFALSHFLHFAHFAKWKWKWLLCRLRIGSFNTCPPSQHLYCSLSHQEKSVYNPLLCTLLLQLTLSYTYVTYVLSMLLLMVCPSSLVILFTVNGWEAISKGSAKIHSFAKFFHPCFLYQGQYYPCGTLLLVYRKRLFNHVISLETGHAKPVFSLQTAGGTSMECLSVPGPRILGENAKVKHTGKVGRAGKFPLALFFVFALSQFSGPDYLRAWNGLRYFVCVYLTLLN